MVNFLDTLKTGDAVNFVGNSPTGFLLKFFTSSISNHSGIVFRLKKNDNGDYSEISKNTEGDLFIFETNSGKRMDSVSKENIVGAAFTKPEKVLKNSNICYVRRMKDEYRDDSFISKAGEFTKSRKGTKFPSDSGTFFSIWLGLDKTPEQDQLFCSQLMAKFYEYCLGETFIKITKKKIENLQDIFGKESPKESHMITPDHFLYKNTPNSPIFFGENEIVFNEPADLIFTIIQPLLIALVIILALYMSLVNFYRQEN